ncbi:hypothetical protein [Winogradskyella alexanderae]|uniref:STAS/SEC14 domain-containing protein n=1 Tax=Winogradskyella alexanderae TaxID=2877123 RepID=A0ABS7XUV9_9FLAO|nr:hypothetical protein [Winogradskyella alexanderae]MCA0133223.1 hypothetical protein [Winogradskyella alexanderae]
MRESLTLDFCNVSIYDNYMVVVINEGVTVLLKHNNILAELAKDYFENKPFVYITHRLNSYSVDPNIYIETSKIDNLRGFAVVSKDYKARSNAEVEKMFLSKPFGIFSELEEAYEWANKMVKI